MTRKRSSPMGLEIYLPVLLAFIMLPLITQAAPLQDYTEIQQYTEGCYYNYNHYNEGDRIMTNEPCLNCTCHNKMLMCYLRVCPFTKPIGHDCIVEKREDQCCPIVTCPEVPVDVSHAAPEAGTELRFPEKFGCSINGKFYLEGAQVPSNPNKPCELCYCIKNRTSCLMQECTLHIDGCTPIYNKGSCCPVRYNCDHENDVLELEDHSTTTEVSTTTTTERPTTGFIISSTATPGVSTYCVHNKEIHADGARIPGDTACENCYCMRGDIVCAVQECQMPMINDNGKLCHPMPAAEGECCPSNYVCEDDAATTQLIEGTTLPYTGSDEDIKLTTAAPVKDLHSAIPDEDLQLQTHIDEEETATKSPSTEGEIQEYITEANTGIEPVATETQSKQEVSQQESVTSDVKNAEVTTMSSIDLKPVESEEFVTKASTSSDELQESLTKQPVAAYPAQEDKATTKVPTAAYEIPEISTGSTDSGEGYFTVTSTKATPESDEFITKGSALVEGQSTTLIIPTDVDVSEETTKFSDKVKPIPGEEDITQVPSVGEEINLTKEDEKEQVSTMDVENATQRIETEIAGTKATVTAEQLDQYATESPSNLSEEQGIPDEKADELFTTKIEEPSVTGKPKEEETAITDAVFFEEEEDLSTDEPKTEETPEAIEKEKEDAFTKLPTTSDDHELTTQSANENETVIYTEASTDQMPTKLPAVSNVEQLYTTTSAKIEDNIPTKAPVYIDTEPTTEGLSGASAEPPVKFEEHHSPDQSKPMFEGEFGSGDYTTEVTSFEISTVGLSISSLAQEEEDEEPIINQKTSTELSEAAQDNKLIDHTTIKPSESDKTTKIAETLKEDEDELELTTMKPIFTVLPTNAGDISEEVLEEKETITKIPSEHDLSVSTGIPSKTHYEEPTEKEISAEDKVDITTMAILLDEKRSTTEQVPSDGGAEILSTPSIADESQKKHKTDEDAVESEDVTSHETIEEHDQETSTAPKVVTTTERKEDDHKVLPEIGVHKIEGQTGITDSPMLIMDISAFTTSQPTAQADIRTEPDANLTASEGSSSDIEEGAPTVPHKPLFEITRVDEMPDMQLPLHIPGEGSCLVGHKTYENNSIVPSSDECHLVCMCTSSIINCKRIKCDLPENIEKCIRDKVNSKKCCPSYICDTETTSIMSEDTSESIEEDSSEEDQHTTAPLNVPIEHKDVEAETFKSKTTTEATFDAVRPGVSIPEIEMPVAMTDEPMSHIKDEDEFEQRTTKSPIKTAAEDKQDIFIEDRSTTTPAPVVHDVNVQQSTTSIAISEQEVAAEKVTVETPENEAVPSDSASQEQPVKKFEEHTTSAFVESATDSAMHVSGDEKLESEIETTTIASTTVERQTGEPIKKEEFEDEHTKLQTSTTSPLAEENVTTDSSKKPETVTIISPSEEAYEPENQTDKQISHDTTIEPHITLPIETHEHKEPEMQTKHPIDTDELSVDKTTSITSGETQEVVVTSSTVGKDTETLPISTKFEEYVPSTEQDIYESTTITSVNKSHSTKVDEENLMSSTPMPSISDLEEHVSSTTKESSDKIKDYSIVHETLDEKLESTSSTSATVTEEIYKDLSIPSKAYDKENVEPTQGLSDQEIKLSTVVSETSGEASSDHVSSTEDKILDYTIADVIEQQTTSEVPISETSEHSIPETQKNVTFFEDHTITPTYAATFDEKTSVYTTISSSKGTDIVTTSSSTTSMNEVPTELPSNNIIKDIPTTEASGVEKGDENRESAEAHTDVSVERQTESAEEVESEEMTEIAADSIEKVTEVNTERVKDENEENVTRPPTASVDYEPQKALDHTTFPAITSDESGITSSEGNIRPVKEDTLVSVPETNTFNDSTTVASDIERDIKSSHIPTKQPFVDLIEEGSGESVESEEEISSEPTLIHNTGESVTQHVETTSTIMPIIEEEEKEASGEEGEDAEMEASTYKSHVSTVDHQSEIEVTTEHAEVSNKLNELLTEKGTSADSESLTNAPIVSDNISGQNTEKDIFPSTTKVPYAEPNIDYVTEKLTEEDSFSLGTKEPVEDIEHVTETEEESIREHAFTENVNQEAVSAVNQVTADSEGVSTELPGTENMVHATKAPVASVQQHENENETLSESPIATEDVADKHHQVSDIPDITKAPVSADEIKTVPVVIPVEESVENATKPEEIEQITELPEGEVETSTEFPMNFEDISTTTIKKNVTEESFPADNDSATTQVSILEESEGPKISEISTTKLPSDETYEVTPSLIPSGVAEQSTGQQTKEVFKEDIDVLSATHTPTEGADITTTEASEEREGLGITKVPQTLETEATTVKLAILADKISDVTDKQTEIKEESEEDDKMSDQVTQVPTILQNEVAEHATELPTTEIQTEEESNKHITEMPIIAEVLSGKIPDNMELATELSAIGIESEKDDAPEESTSVSLFAEESTDNIPEEITELSTKYTKLDTETHAEVADKATTALPDVAEVSSVTMEITIEDEHLHKLATELPVEAHISTDLPEHDSKLPTKYIESDEESHEHFSELPAIAEIATDKLPGHITEILTQDVTEVQTAPEEMVSYEHVTQLPVIAPMSSERLPEHITKLPAENMESTVEVHGSNDKLLPHSSESPSKDVESEENSYQESTELSSTSDATDKLAEIPTKNAEPEGENYEKGTKFPDVAYEVSTSRPTVAQTTESATREDEYVKETPTEAAEDISAVKLHPPTTAHPLFPHYTTLSSVALDSRTDDATSNSTPGSAKDEEAFTTSATTIVSTTTTEPVTTTSAHYQPQAPIYGQPPQYGPTQYEDEYTDEDEGEVFGPGTCRYGGKLYVSAQQIPRDDPCDFCFCFRSDIICLQQSCPPPISGCHEEPISGFCCPRYECPVSMATVLNITTSTTTTSTTLPPHFLHHSYGNNVQRNGCLINGRSYRVGEKIESTSGPCINCTCGGDGKMKCDPQACVPEPTMQQVMAVVAAGRKR